MMSDADFTALALKVSKHVKQGENVTEFVGECTGEAIDLVDHHIGSVKVPNRVYDRAVVEVAADLYYRRNAQNGIAQFDNGEALDALRIGNDPLRAAKAILKPFLGAPIA